MKKNENISKNMINKNCTYYYMQAIKNNNEDSTLWAIFKILKELSEINSEWKGFIGNLNGFESNGTYQNDGLADIAHDIIENVDVEIWMSDGIISERVLLKKLLNRLYSNK